MAAFTRPVASSSSTTTTPSQRVREAWQDFEKTVATSKNVLQHKISAANDKADEKYHKTSTPERTSLADHEEIKNRIANKFREEHYEKLKGMWAAKLAKAGLKAEDWIDITPEEMEAIATNLNGGLDTNSDEDLVVVNNPVPHVSASASLSPPQPFTHPHFYQRPIAPSFSTSTRATNVSSISTISTASTASSYALVHPNEFHSGEEDDFYYPVTAVSHDLTSDDDDGVLPPTRQRGHTFGGWSSGDSLASSLHNSVESLPNAPAPPLPRPLLTNNLQNPSFSRLASRNLLTEDDNIETAAAAAVASTSKTKVRPFYIGPQLDDSNEPQAESDDFELFKMQTRMQKIVEFHQQAALAEIRLSIEIYKDRETQGPQQQQQQQKKEVSSRVLEHQRKMTELQKTKEEERKMIVKAERTKRLSELQHRRRSGRSNTIKGPDNIKAPKPSAPTNPSWLTDFQETVSPQLESNFNLEKLLATDPTQQQQSVEQYLRYALLGSSAPSSPMQASMDSVSYGQGYESSSRAGPPPRWNTSSSSASSHNPTNSFSGHSQNQHSTRTNSKGKQKAKPSLFGEDSDSGEEEEEEDEEDEEGEEENDPPTFTQTANANPFARANVAVADAFLQSQMQSDPYLAAAFSQYSGNGNGNGNSPPIPSWGAKPTTIVQPTPSQNQIQMQNHWGATTASATKEVRATPVAHAGGWLRKKQQQPAANNNSNSNNNSFAFGPAPQDISSPQNPHFIPEQYEPIDRLTSSMSGLTNGGAQGQGRKFISTPMDPQSQSAAWEMMAEHLSMSALGGGAPNGNGNGNVIGKGKKPMMSSMSVEVEESQSIWEQMVEKQTPTATTGPASFFSSNKAAAATPAVPLVPVPPIVGTKPGKRANASPPAAAAPTPAPAPVVAAAPAPTPVQPASKKMNKKQRQAANKKNTAAVVAEPDPTPDEPVVVVPESQSPPSLFDEPPAPPPPEATSLLSRMMPAIGRARKDSAPPAPSGWDDSASITTPRPASKIPAHLLHQQEASASTAAGGTPRPNLFKKFNTTDNVLNGVTPASAAAARMMALDQNPTGTIKSSQWGSASSVQTPTTTANRSIWNVFGGAPAGTKPSQLAESGIHIPGGFDVNGGEGEEGAGGGGGGEDDDGGGGEEEEVQTPHVWKASASIWGKKAEKTPAPAPPVAPQKQQPLSAAAALRQRRMSEATAAGSSPASAPPRGLAAKAPAVVAATPVAAAATQPQAIPTPQTGKKGARAKKNAKGKKVTMEEVPDEENTDSKGGSLPVDSRALLLPANEPASPVILEPKPSVAPRMFDSIFGYGDDDREEDEDAFSSPHVATPSTAPSSPPDIFGDEARLAAAIKEIQASNAKYSERLDGVSSGGGIFGGAGGGGGGGSGGAWGSMAPQQHDRWVPSAMSSASTAPKASAWGPINKDKGKGKMTDVEDSPKAPLPNMKRNKPAAGWL